MQGGWFGSSKLQIIPKENLIKELSFDEAKQMLDSFNDSVINGSFSLEEYFSLFGDGNSILKQYVTSTDQQNQSIQGLVKYSQEARDAQIAQNEAIKNGTISAKAGQLALKGLAIAGNMLLMWGITKGIELIVKGIDQVTNSAKYCKERVDEVMNSFNSTTSEINKNAQTISKIADRYDELSKHVNRLGENVSLTEAEFEEYHDITSQIAEMYPDLVDGWDAQGNAIVNLTDSLKELNAEYEKSLHNANLTLMESKGDIFKNYQNTIKDIDQSLRYAEVALQLSQGNGGSFYDYIYDSDGRRTSYYKAFEDLGLSVDDMVSGNLDTLERQITLKIQSLKDEADKATKDVTPLFKAMLQEDLDYQSLNTELQNATLYIVDNIPSSLMDSITEKGDSAGSDFIEGLVDKINENEDVQNAILQLFTVDLTELSPYEAEKLVNSYITLIQDMLSSLGYDIPTIDLKVNLGFEDVDDLAYNYRTILNDAASNYLGMDRRDAARRGLSNDYQEIYDKIDEFAKEHSINTQDEIAAFQKALEESDYDIEKAFENYLHEASNRSIISLSDWQSSNYSSGKTYSDLIKDWKSEISELQSLLSDIQSGKTTVTAGDIVAQFPDMQPYIEQYGDLSAAVDAFMRDSYDELIRKFGDTSSIEGFSYQLEYLQGILNEGLGGSNDVDELIESYEELIDVLDQVNSDHTFTAEEIAALINKYDALQDAIIVTTDGYKLESDALVDLINDYVDFSNTAISKQIELTKATIDNIKTRVSAWGMELEAMQAVVGIYNASGGSESAVAKYVNDNYGTGLTSATPAIIAAAQEYVDANNQLDKLLEQLNNSYSTGSKYKSGSGSSSSSSTKDFEETYDWIETAIERIERSISNLDLKASSVYRSWSERNSNLKAELLDVKKEMDIQASGYNRYMQQANSVGLSEEWASKVRNGQIDINTITDEGLAERISEYENWYKKALDCQDAIESLRESVSELYKTAFDNIVSQFDSIVSVVENSKSMLDEYINQAEESGYIVNAAYYEALMNVERKNIEQLTKERSALQSSLADAVNSGTIKEGSEAWADMIDKINDVTLSIEEANTAMIQYSNSIRDIQWQIFDLIQDRISSISSEADFLIDLLSNDKLYDDRGQLTGEGSSTMGLHGMNYNVYMAQADKYAQEMLRINEELAKDPHNQDLYNRRQELLELQQEMILAAEDEKKAIVDMVEEGINLELDALKELIDTYTDALDAQKD